MSDKVTKGEKKGNSSNSFFGKKGTARFFSSGSPDIERKEGGSTGATGGQKRGSKHHGEKKRSEHISEKGQKPLAGSVYLLRKCWGGIPITI